MTITATPPRSPLFRASQIQAPPQGEPKDLDPENFTWGDAGRGLLGAVSSAVIYGVGITADTLVRAPQALYHAEKGLIQTPLLGPVLKFTLAPLLLCGAIAAPVVAVLGGTGYGLYKGFVDAAEKGVLESAREAVRDLKEMHAKGLSAKLIEGIKELSTKPLPEGEEPYDISLGGGLKGLAAATAGAAIDGVGVGVVTLVQAPRAFYKLNKALWQSEAALPLKTIGSILSLPATPLAVGLSVVGGALYGMGVGAKDGYTEGLGEAVSNSGQAVLDYNSAVNKALQEL